MRERKNLLWIPFIATLIVSLLSAAAPATVEAEMYVDPSLSTASPGDRFTVNVMAHHVTQLFVFEYGMYFDPSVLMCVSVTPVDFEYFPPPLQKIDNIVGYIKNVGARPLGEKDGLTGLLTLAAIEFQVKVDGVSFLQLSFTQMIDVDGVILTHTAYGGYFDSVLPMSAPCLWVAGHDGKVYPEKKSVSIREEQTLYADVTNERGAQPPKEREIIGAYVSVKFDCLIVEIGAVLSYWSDETWIDPDTTATLSSTVYPSVPGTWVVTGHVYYRLDLLSPTVQYANVEGSLGGEGTSKSTGTSFKVG